ncbi:hypothetical protein AB0H37_00050 [Actinomadura sp. NPDC023710]|uniref:hypothetical protein n=1 Tax=Actinomadura sp. NPDC023710 TaxID=3158219 RepID=UPI0033E394C4
MAVKKVERWWPAIAHGMCYALPFLLITRSVWALLIVGGTHAVLDHYQAAKYVVWAQASSAPGRSGRHGARPLTTRAPRPPCRALGRARC